MAACGLAYLCFVVAVARVTSVPHAYPTRPTDEFYRSQRKYWIDKLGIDEETLETTVAPSPSSVAEYTLALFQASQETASLGPTNAVDNVVTTIPTTARVGPGGDLEVNFESEKGWREFEGAEVVFQIIPSPKFRAMNSSLSSPAAKTIQAKVCRKDTNVCIDVSGKLRREGKHDWHAFDISALFEKARQEEVAIPSQLVFRFNSSQTPPAYYLEDKNAPLLVLFNDEAVYKLMSDFEVQSSLRRHRRSLPSETRQVGGSGGNAVASGQCQLATWNVEWNEIDFHNVVLQPTTFQANLCLGECPVPLETNAYKSNHAYMRNAYRNIGRNDIPAACCVPSNLVAISMLHHRGSDLVIRQVPGMIATSCMCA